MNSCTVRDNKTLFHSSEWHALGKKTALNEGEDVTSESNE